MSHILVVTGSTEEEVSLSIDVGDWLEGLAVPRNIGDLELRGRGGRGRVVAFAS
jgi:hypothetical protein